jgi:hypothetical protein
MKKITLGLVAMGIAIITMSWDILSTNGKSGATGSPGEVNCTDCHSTYAVNTGGGSITIAAPTLTGWQYIPSTTYAINVTVARTGNSLFGVDFEALQSSGANAGTLVITNSAETQIKNTTISGNSRSNVVHKTNGGATTNTHTFSFNWTAPATNVGNVTFYAAGDACNANGSTSGDYVYTSSQVVTPLTTGLSELNPASIGMSIMPNPATEYCTLNYNLSSNSKVAIELISLNGQVVKSYINQEETAGTQNHTLTFDQSVAKGIYIVSLDINGAMHFQKIVIQ